MNQVYKVVLCAATGTYKAVPEFARSKSKSSKATVGALAIITAITFSGGAQAATEGIQTGVNDIAIGEQATSTGQNNIAIGQGSFAAGGTLTEAEANQLIASSQVKINQISNTQKTIAQKEAAIAQYLATVEKVERNQAEIERLTGLNNTEKSKTSGLTTAFETANSIYLQKQAEVDTKVGFLEQLDLNDYGPLNESGLSQIANDVKLYIEGESSANSLGDQFYQEYVNAYIEKIAKLDYTISLSEAAASAVGFYDEDTQQTVSAKSIMGAAASTNTYTVRPTDIPTTAIEVYEQRLQDITADKEYFNNNKDTILDGIINTNSQIKAMYEDESTKASLVDSMNLFYNYKSNEIRLAILQKQTGVMDGTEPDYLAKVNEVKALKSENAALLNSKFTYSSAMFGNYINSKNNAATWLATIASLDSNVFSADTIAEIRDAESIQANTLKTYLTDQIAAVKKDSDDTSKALSDNQKVIAAYELNIKNRQPTAEELQAYNKAKAEEAILIQQQENLANQTAELQALQEELKDGKDALALGANAKAIGDGAVAVGANNDVIASEAVALGTGNNVTGDNSVAIGTGNTVSGAQSIAVGTGHTVTGANSGAFGDPNVVSGNESYAYGNNNTISSDNSHVIGNGNNTAAMSSLIFGNNIRLTAQAANSIVIGSGATSSVDGGVAIGNNSVANRTNTVSVGSTGNERQVVNVAAGTSATDAVNVEQLNNSLGGKADTSYVNASNDSQNTVIAGKASQASLDQTNSNVATNSTAISENRGDIASNTSSIAENTTAIGNNAAVITENRNIITNNNTAINTKVDNFVTAQGNKDGSQDVVIAGKVDKDAFVAEQARQDVISNSKADKSELDATNQMVADNKSAQATTDANQNTVIAGKADQSALDATNQTVADNKTTQAGVDAAQDSAVAADQLRQDNVIAANKADADSKIAATNQTITDNQAAQATTDANQNIAITQNATDIAGKADQSALDATNQTIADNQAAQATTDADQNTAIDGKADQAALNATNSALDATNQTIADNQAAQATTDANQNAAIAGKADTSYVDNKNASQDTTIGNLQAQTSQNAIDISNKADISYVDAQNDAQNTAIDKNTADILTKADVAYVDSENDAQNTAIDKNTADILTKADVSYVDSKNDAQNTAINKNTADILTKADVAYVNSENNAQNTAIDKNTADISNKADLGYVDAQNNAQNDTISAVQNQTNQNAIDISNKADVSYVDSKDDAQNVIIASKTDQSDFVAEQARQNAINESQSIAISSKVDKDAFVAEQERQNTVNDSQNAVISGKVDKDVFVAEQARQNTINESQSIAISSKVDKDAFVAEQERQNTVNDSQNAVISRKVDKDVFVADQARQDAENEAQNVEIAAKADTSYVDEKNNAQDAVTSKNTSDIAVNTIDIAELKALDTAMVETIESSQTTLNSRITEMVESQSTIDEDQNRMIAENANRFAGLDQRIGSLDKTLSSGVASALAIGAMPTMSIAGAHMITGGSGYFNGQGSMAVGLTGTTDSGKVSYKIGGSYTQDGGSAFSIGSGYRWK